MKPLALPILLIALAIPAAAVADDVDAERDAWRSEIAAARARADAQRAMLKAELERRRAEQLQHPPSAEDLDRERAQRLSEEVKNDYSLQRGDIVSTASGLFVYIGNPQAERTPDDFVPLSTPSQKR